MKSNSTKNISSNNRPAHGLSGKLGSRKIDPAKFGKPKLPKKKYPNEQKISEEDLDRLISVTGLTASTGHLVKWRARNNIRTVLFEYHTDYRPAHRWEYDEKIYNIRMITQHAEFLIESLENSLLGTLRNELDQTKKGKVTFDTKDFISNLRQLSELAKVCSLSEARARIGLDGFYSDLAYFVGYHLSITFSNLFDRPAGTGESGHFNRFVLHILNELNTDPKKKKITPAAVKSAFIQFRTGSRVRKRVAKARKK